MPKHGLKFYISKRDVHPLETILAQYGLTQAEAARLMGVANGSVISNFVTGKVYPPPKMLAILHYLGVNVDEFLKEHVAFVDRWRRPHVLQQMRQLDKEQILEARRQANEIRRHIARIESEPQEWDKEGEEE